MKDRSDDPSHHEQTLLPRSYILLLEYHGIYYANYRKLLATEKQHFMTRHSRFYSLSYFSFQPVLLDWCNKGRGMCYPVCGMVYIKEPLLLIGKSSPCGDSGFPLSLSEWSFTICLTPYNRSCLWDGAYKRTLAVNR